MYIGACIYCELYYIQFRLKSSMAMADPDDTPVVPPSPVENTTDPTFKVEGNFLSLYDLNPIFEALIAVAHTWYNLGLALGVHEPTLKEIEADYSKCRNRLREMLSHWLRNGSSITWQNIVRALCSQSVDQRKFAEEIGTYIIIISCMQTSLFVKCSVYVIDCMCPPTSGLYRILHFLL